MVYVFQCNGRTWQGVYNHDIISLMKIRDHGKMTGTVTVIGISHDDVPSSLQLRLSEYFESQLSVRVEATKDLNSTISVVYSNQDDLQSELQAKVFSELLSSLSIRFHNKMTGVVDVLEPPVITTKLSPIKDTYVRKYFPKMNYGHDGDMFVGASFSGDIYRSLVQFGELGIKSGMTIKSATLVMQEIYPNAPMDMSIHEIDPSEKWDEHGVTWDNQPKTSEYLTEVTIREPREYRIDLTSLVDGWYRGSKENNGLFMQSSDESHSVYKSFGTKESKDNSIYLEIQYYDPYIYSIGRSQIPAELFVFGSSRRDLESSVFVYGKDWEDSLNSEIIVRDPKIIDSTIVVTKPSLESSVWVIRKEYTDLESSLSVRVAGTPMDEEGRLTVNKPCLSGSIYVSRSSLLDSEIMVIGVGRENTQSSITVNKPELVSTIFVPSYADMEAEMFVIGNHISNLTSELTVTRSTLEGNLVVGYYSELESSITVKLKRYQDLDGSIYVMSPFFPAEIRVRALGDDSQHSELYVKWQEDIDSSLTNRAIEDYRLESELYVRGVDDNELESTINVVFDGKNELPSELSIGHNNDFDSELTVVESTINELESSLVIKYADNEDLESVLQLKHAFDISSSISIRQDGELDVQSQFIVRLEDYQELPSEMVIVPTNDLETSIVVKREEYYDLIGTLRPIFTGKFELSSEIQLRLKYEIDSTLIVKQVGYSSIPTTVVVRVNMAEDMESRINVSSVDTILYAFIM